MITLKVQSSAQLQQELTKHPDKTIQGRLHYFRLEDLYSRFTDAAIHWHTLREGKRIVGVAKVAPSPTETDTLWLNFLSVDPKYRNQGLGARLTRSVLRQAQGANKILSISSYSFYGRKFLAPTIAKEAKKIKGVRWKESDSMDFGIHEKDLAEALLMGYTCAEIERERKFHKTEVPDLH